MPPFKSPYPPIIVRDESYATYLFRNEHKFSADSPAYVDGITGQTTTRWAQRTQAIALARSLRNAHQAGLLPLRRGSGVIVFSPNSLLYPVVMMAMGIAGICPAYANANYVLPELVHAFKITGSTHILVAPPLLSLAVSAFAKLGQPMQEAKKRVIIMAHKDSIPTDLQCEGWKGIDDLIPDDSLNLPEKYDGADAQQTAAIYFSSGTTGMNKAIMLSHRNVNAVLAQLVAHMLFYDHGRDVIMGIAPFYHILGAHCVVFSAWLKGVPTVVLPRFEPESFVRAIERFRITNAVLVPPLLTFLARTPLLDKYDVSSLKHVGVGAAPVIPAMYDHCIERFAKKGSQLHCGGGYGMTETSGILSLLDGEQFERNKGGVGALLPNLEGRLVGDDGEDVAEGSPGELWVRGPNIAKGYYNNPKANEETFTPDGWLKTGDIVVRNSEGVMFIVDRKKELVKYKGFQVAPAELESVLSGHPGVEDSGVVGIFSETEATELPRAYIVPRDRSILQDKTKGAQLAEDIHAWMKERVANFKLLRGGITYVDAIPRSAAGKILRKNLREVAHAHPMKTKL